MQDVEHSGNTTVPTPEDTEDARSAHAPQYPALVVLWCAEDPRRLGEIGRLEERGRSYTFGREERSELPRLRFYQQRPGSLVDAGPFVGRGLSREQLRLRARAYGIEMEVVGRCRTFVNGQRVEQGKTFVLVSGDTVYLEGQLLMGCTRRGHIPALRHFPQRACGQFGAADALNLVGESPEIWALREAIASAAKLNQHVLISGGSGSGKELVARGIHVLSKRAGGPFVACNCAAIPRTLTEAELFGHAQDYPNRGMQAQSGYVGAAEGGTLLLDEIGEMPLDAQAALLRFLDSNEGAYQRLGETRPRRAALVVVAATNRPLSELKFDVRARFGTVLEVPSLQGRREDIPMIVRHLLLRAEASGNELASDTLLADRQGVRYPNLRGRVMEELVREEYPENVRSLEIELFRVLQGLSKPKPRTALDAAALADGAELDADTLLAGLERTRGNVSKLATETGRTRQEIYRSMKKHGLRDD